MLKYKQFEETLKHLDRWANDAGKWQSDRTILDDKLEAYKLQKALQEARRILRLQIFVFEDMCKELKTEDDDVR